MFAKVVGAIISIPILFFLPGLALVRSRLYSSGGGSLTERLLMVVMVSVTASSLVAFLLAECGFLRIWLLDVIVAAVAVAVRLVFGSTGRSLFFPRPFRWEAVILLVLVAVSVVMFFKPAEFVSGDGDRGYYYNNAYHIAQEGEVRIHDPRVAALPDAEVEMFYGRGIAQFNPFHLRGGKTGYLEPLLYHMLPVWMGVFIMMFSKSGALFVTPIFALLAVIAVYALGLRAARRALGPGSKSIALGAGAGACLMAVFFPEMWFARYPSSEVFGQCFILSSLLFFIAFLEDRGNAAALACALCAAVAALVRPEALLMFIPLLAVMVYEAARDRCSGAGAVLANGLMAGLLVAWLYLKFVAYGYIHTNARKVFPWLTPRSHMDLFLWAFLGLVAVGFVFFNLRPLHRLLAKAFAPADRAGERTRKTASVAFRGAVSLLVFAAFFYFYFLAPDKTTKVIAPQKYFYLASAYLGGIAVFIFVAALAYYLFESDPRAAVVVAFLVVGLTVAFTETKTTAGYMPWLERRYLPVVFPFFFVGIGYLISRLFGARMAALKTAGAILAAGFLAFFLFFSVPAWSHTDFTGFDDQMRFLASQVDGDVVIFTNPYFGESVGMPLRYQYGVDARVAYDLEDARAFGEAVKKYNEQGRKVLVQGSVTMVPKLNPAVFDYLTFQPAFKDHISYPRIHKSFTTWPRQFVTEGYDLDFYYATPR